MVQLKNRKRVSKTWNNEALRQLKANLMFLVLLFLLPLFCLLIVVFNNLHHNIPLRIFMDEPVAVGGVPYYTGFISNMSVLFWCATVVVCLFFWVLFQRLPSEKKFSNFLLYFGLLSVLLLFDDLLLLHEHIYYNRLGIPEGLTYIIYVVLIFTGMVVFRSEIIQTPFLLLLIAFVYFGISIFIDGTKPILGPYLNEWRIFYEDGFKLLGIAAWFGYYSRACLLRLISLL